jgi:hypothetical protein
MGVLSLSDDFLAFPAFPAFDDEALLDLPQYNRICAKRMPFNSAAKRLAIYGFI